MLKTTKEKYSLQDAGMSQTKSKFRYDLEAGLPRTRRLSVQAVGLGVEPSCEFPYFSII